MRACVFAYAYTYTCTLSYTYTHVTGFFAFNLERKKKPTLDYLVLQRSLRDHFRPSLAASHLKNDDARSIHGCMIKQLKWRKWWWHHLPTAISITTRCSDYRVFRCQNIFISFSAWMIYVKNSKTSFSTYRGRLWLKSTMGLRERDLYELTIENNTTQTMCTHKCHKHMQLSGTYVHLSCHLPPQIITIVFENNHQGPCKFFSK